MRGGLALAALVTLASVAASGPQLTSSEMRRVLDISRGSDSVRERFHAPYIFKLTGARLEYVVVDRVEVITELRRLELIGEEHARLNDVFGRGPLTVFGRGPLTEVEKAMVPWRNRIAIVACLSILPTMRVIPDVPPIHAIVTDSPALPLDTRRNGIYNSGDEGSFLVGGTIEELYDASALGTGTHPVAVIWEGQEIGRVTIDFGALK